nr:9852_t:CDS:2 [Entrophospora candida]
MSWQSYIDNQLLATGKIAQAAIYGHDNSLWATSPGFKVSTLVAAFDNADKIQANGIYCNNIKYITTTAGDDNILGRKGSDGVVIFKTSKAIIVGTYLEGTAPGGANKVVADLGEYLKNSGYDFYYM